MIGDNASVTIRRKGSFNAGTKVTGGYADLYTGVSCFVQDVSRSLRLRGFAAEYDYEVQFDPATDVRDGDQLTGLNPMGLTKPPIYAVNHVAIDFGGLGAHKSALVKALGSPTAT